MGNKIKFTDSRREAKVGNVLSIGKISEGMPIYNVELSPGDGGKLVRAAGNNATVVRKRSDQEIIAWENRRKL